jgi:ribosomal protein S18 acetylase RimI-like enzyme
MSIAIRRADLDSLDDLVPLFDAYREFYGQPSDLARARHWLERRIGGDEAIALIAGIERRAAGFALLYPGWSSVSTERVYVLNDLYVVPSFRRSGVGHALLDAAAAHARSAGAIRISLETARDNHAARALYTRAGWHADETQWFHVPLGP